MPRLTRGRKPKSKPKPRRIDMSAGDRLADLSGELTLEELGAYTMIGWLEASRGEPIDDDEAWIARKLRKTNPRTVRAVIEKLVAARKIERNGSKLSVPWVRSEYENAINRIETFINNLPNDDERSPEISEINAIASPSAAQNSDRAPAVPVPASSSASSTNPSTAQPTTALGCAVRDPRFDEVRHECMQILGKAGVHGESRIQAWLEEGADPFLDIYPTLRRRKADWRSNNLEYFDGPIADAVASRTKPMPAGQPSMQRSSLAERIEASFSKGSLSERLEAHFNKGKVAE